MILPRQAGGVTRIHIGQAFAVADASGIEASRRRNPKALSECLLACGEITTTLEGSVRCADFCRCVHETDNSVWTCFWQMVEDMELARV